MISNSHLYTDPSVLLPTYLAPFGYIPSLMTACHHEAISAELKLAYSKQTSLVSRNEKSTTGVVSLFKSSMRSSSSQTAQTNIYNMQCLD